MKAARLPVALIAALGPAGFACAAQSGDVESPGELAPSSILTAPDGNRLIYRPDQSGWTDSYPAYPSRRGFSTLHLSFDFSNDKREAGEPARSFGLRDFLLPTVIGRATLAGGDEIAGIAARAGGYPDNYSNTVDLYFNLPKPVSSFRSLRIETTLVQITRWMVYEFPNLSPVEFGSQDQLEVGHLVGHVSGNADQVAIFLTDLPSDPLDPGSLVYRYLTANSVGQRLDVQDANGFKLNGPAIANGGAFLFERAKFVAGRKSPSGPVEVTVTDQGEKIAFPITVHAAIPDVWEAVPLEFTAENFELPPRPQAAP